MHPDNFYDFFYYDILKHKISPHSLGSDVWLLNMILDSQEGTFRMSTNVFQMPSPSATAVREGLSVDSHWVSESAVESKYGGLMLRSDAFGLQDC